MTAPSSAVHNPDQPKEKYDAPFYSITQTDKGLSIYFHSTTGLLAGKRIHDIQAIVHGTKQSITFNSCIKTSIGTPGLQIISMPLTSKNTAESKTLDESVRSLIHNTCEEIRDSSQKELREKKIRHLSKIAASLRQTSHMTSQKLVKIERPDVAQRLEYFTHSLCEQFEKKTHLFNSLKVENAVRELQIQIEKLATHPLGVMTSRPQGFHKSSTLFSMPDHGYLADRLTTRIFNTTIYDSDEKRGAEKAANKLLLNVFEAHNAYALESHRAIPLFPDNTPK